MQFDVPDRLWASRTGHGFAMKKIILLSLAAVFIAGAAVGITLLFVGGETTNAETTEAVVDEVQVAEAEISAQAEPIYHALDPAFVVAFNSPTVARFLQVSVEVMTRDDDVIETIKYHMPAIRDRIVMLFSGQQSQELETPEGKERLRSEILAGIQEIHKEHAGTPGVEAVYFTSFVMQ